MKRISFIITPYSLVENLNNLDKMSPRGFFIALPLPIIEGSASPIRAIGFCE
jgi:kynurenine formamidase